MASRVRDLRDLELMGQRKLSQFHLVRKFIKSRTAIAIKQNVVLVAKKNRSIRLLILTKKVQIS